MHSTGSPHLGLLTFSQFHRWSNTLKDVQTFEKWVVSSGAESLFQNMTALELLALLERLFVRESEQLSTTLRRWNWATVFVRSGPKARRCAHVFFCGRPPFKPIYKSCKLDTKTNIVLRFPPSTRFSFFVRMTNFTHERFTKQNCVCAMRLCVTSFNNPNDRKQEWRQDIALLCPTNCSDTSYRHCELYLSYDERSCHFSKKSAFVSFLLGLFLSVLSSSLTLKIMSCFDDNSHNFEFQPHWTCPRRLQIKFLG